MSTFNSRLGIGDMIYSVNSEAYNQSYLIGYILFSKKDTAYLDHLGVHICYEWELDNIQIASNRFYFASKNKRDKFIETNLS